MPPIIREHIMQTEINKGLKNFDNFNLIHVFVFLYFINQYYKKFLEYTGDNSLGITIMLLFIIIFISFFVTIVNSLNEDIRFNLKANEFDEVWFIHKGFPYGIFSEVKNLCKCKVKEFISVDSLVNKLAEGGRL